MRAIYSSAMMLTELFGRDDVDATGRSIDRSIQKWNLATQIICITAMTIFFGLRSFARLVIMDGYRKEDCKSHEQPEMVNADNPKGPCLGAWVRVLGLLDRMACSCCSTISFLVSATQ